jgi:pilus assembly protein Flp/PilA
MNTMFLKLFVKVQDVMSREEGQDLIEYALVAAIIALGCVTLLKSMSTNIQAIFTAINAQLTAAI